MAQAQIDRKRSLVEQALETSLIELKKRRKENPTKSKEKKEKPMAMKKSEQMAKLRTKELRHLEVLKKKKKKKEDDEKKQKNFMRLEEWTNNDLTKTISAVIQKEDEKYAAFLKENEALKKKKKNRPPLSTLKIEEANKIAAMEREAKKLKMDEALQEAICGSHLKATKMDMPSSITP